MKLSIECLLCLFNQVVRLGRVHIDCEEAQRRLL